jgi:hypothetical protein
MAIQVVPGQVQQSDPYPTGPTVNSQRAREIYLKASKLTSANFTTGNTDTLLVVLPADATILGFRLWVKTQLNGGSVSAATLALGSASGGAQFHAASALAFGTTGTYTAMPTPLAIFQNYQVPLGGDIQIWGRGVATTGNPTGGELYLLVEYTR